MMQSDKMKFPKWLLALEEADLRFIKEFIINSGSLKEMAKIYDVSYPTMRLRLDRLIDKIKLHDMSKDSNYVLFIKEQVIEGKIGVDVAKLLIDKYRQEHY